MHDPGAVGLHDGDGDLTGEVYRISDRKCLPLALLEQIGEGSSR